MNIVNRALIAAFMILAVHATARAGGYRVRVVASGLARPTGITVEGSEVLYFTLVPTPGVPGSNSVARLDLETGVVETLHSGEPEPRNIVEDRQGNLYWTCTSAGVILRRTEEGVTMPILTGLQRPIGIAVDRRGNVFYTEVPSPGVAGAGNKVSVFDGTTQTVLHMGEPEPTDIAVAKDGTLYWTCKSAGVILTQYAGVTRVLVAGLNKPSGIALDHKDQRLFFTEVPQPGVAGGANRVVELDLATGAMQTVHQGDPEPADITVASNGSVYWTCTTAGVIVEAKPVRE